MSKNIATRMPKQLENYVPEGYKTKQEYLDYIKKEYEADVAFDKENTDMALDDLKFLAGEQWDPLVKAYREKNFRPVETINVLPQYVGQVVGERRMNKTTIKVRPLRDGTAQIAEIRSGLIKSIEVACRAERAYDMACEDQVACGIGNLRVDLQYAGNDIFEQDIVISHIPNPLAVVWDRMSTDPTGRDARRAVVRDTLPKSAFEKAYPWAENMGGGYGEDTGPNGEWSKLGDVVNLMEVWEIVEKPAKFALMNDGSVMDITDKAEEDYADKLYRHPETGLPRTRDSFRTYARMHLLCGWAVLSMPYEVPLSRLPIVRVEGRVTRVADKRVRFGLVRNAKGPMRIRNYVRSQMLEVVAMSPKVQWTAEAKAVAGREDDFRKAHLSGDNLLIHNDGTEAPKRVDPIPLPAALMNESQQSHQDIKDTTGLQDASLGMKSNEVSGRAIDARRRAGDVATTIYHDNTNNAIQEVGDIANQFIPIAYDTTRIIRVIGDDEVSKLMEINGIDEESIDITLGKYDVMLETGPSFSTQRAEALDAMMTLIQTSPDLMQVMGDLVAKNMDWPGAYEIAARLRKIIPKELLEEETGLEGATAEQEQQQPSPEEMQQMAQMEQQQQLEAAAMQHQADMQDIERRKGEAEAQKAEQEVLQAGANAAKADAERRRAEVEAEAAPAIVQAKIQQVQRQATQPAQQPRQAQPRRQERKGQPQ